jgi:ADP-ribose pyrophosphatase YjhB (NUDIX family)
MQNFENIHQLKNWLKLKGIDTTAWGMNNSKSVEDLWEEIVAGESEIHDSPPLRVVRVVQIVILDGGKILIEEQQYSENQQQYRWLPPSEKIKHGESHIDAAIRGLKEELQVDPDDIKILQSPPNPEQGNRKTQSYPGLPTKYVVYTVEVEVDNLPREKFSTTEVSANVGNSIRRHQWLWVPRTTIDY